MQLDVLVIGVAEDTVAVPISHRVGHELIQRDAGGIDARRRRAGRGWGIGWPVRRARRGWIAARPGAAAIHRFAVGLVVPAVAVLRLLDRHAIGPQQPHRVAAVVQGDVRVAAPQNHEALCFDHCTGGQGIRRRPAVGDVIHPPATEIDGELIGIVQLDVLVIGVAEDAVVVPVGLWVGHEFVEEDAGRVRGGRQGRRGRGRGRWGVGQRWPGPGGGGGRRRGRGGGCGRGGGRGGGRGLVRPTGRGWIGRRPLRAAVHRLAVAHIGRRGRIKVALDLDAVGR